MIFKSNLKNILNEAIQTQARLELIFLDKYEDLWIVKLNCQKALQSEDRKFSLTAYNCSRLTQSFNLTFCLQDNHASAQYCIENAFSYYFTNKTIKRYLPKTLHLKNKFSTEQ